MTDDLISRQKTLGHLRKRLIQTANNNVGFVCDAGSTFQDASERVKTWLDEVPSIDAVPVIRCKDCKWYGRADKRRFLSRSGLSAKTNRHHRSRKRFLQSGRKERRMREYEVYHAWGTITIKADELRIYSILDKPVKIFFIKDGTIVAEFYIDNIAGWAERIKEE